MICVGIDVAKDKHDCCILDSEGTTLADCFTIPNNLDPARINVGSIGYQNTGKDVIVSSLYEVFKTSDDVDDRLLWHWFKSPDFQKLIFQLQEGGVRLYFYYDKLCMGTVSLPSLEEQRKIGQFFDSLDTLITLHQREHIKPILEVKRVKRNE